MYQITNRLNKPIKPQLINVKLLTKLRKLKKRKNNIKKIQSGGSLKFNTENDIFLFIEDNIYYILLLVIFGLGLYYRYRMVQEEREKLLKNNQN